MINWHIVVSALWYVILVDPPPGFGSVTHQISYNAEEAYHIISCGSSWKLLDAPAPETGIYTYSRLSMFVVRGWLRAIITCVVNPSNPESEVGL